MAFKVGPTLVLAATLVAGCARPAPPTVTAADAARAEAAWPGTGVAELDHGRALYMHRCSVCHLPVSPLDKPATEWPSHVREMKTRAHLTDEDAALVERYLVTVASRGP